MYVGHRLNMQLDVQSLFGPYVYIAQMSSLVENPMHPPAFGLIYEGAIGEPGSQPHLDTSLQNVQYKNQTPSHPCPGGGGMYRGVWAWVGDVNLHHYCRKNGAERTSWVTKKTKRFLDCLLCNTFSVEGDWWEG